MTRHALVEAGAIRAIFALVMTQPRIRKRSMRVLLAPEDVELLGRLVVSERSSVRFRRDSSVEVLRSMPSDAAVVVHMADAELAPGYDLPEPDIWLGEDGVGVQLLLCRTVGDEMRSGEMSTVLNAANPGHVAFVGAVFGALRRATKPHVEFLTGKPAPLRIGLAAEQWWLADDQRVFRDGGSTAIRYRVRVPKDNNAARTRGFKEP
jgi:hypothetical protein